MIATITNVTINAGTQVDVTVRYEDKGFEREYIFTLPGGELDGFDKKQLRDKIKAQGEVFKNAHAAKEVAEDLLNQEITI